LGLDEDGRVRLRAETGDVSIALTDIKGAKLVLTDELIAAALKEQEQQV
jgi:ribosome maturation factor RimP